MVNLQLNCDSFMIFSWRIVKECWAEVGIKSNLSCTTVIIFETFCPPCYTDCKIKVAKSLGTWNNFHKITFAIQTGSGKSLSAKKFESPKKSHFFPLQFVSSKFFEFMGN